MAHNEFNCVISINLPLQTASRPLRRLFFSLDSMRGTSLPPNRISLLQLRDQERIIPFEEFEESTTTDESTRDRIDKLKLFFFGINWTQNFCLVPILKIFYVICVINPITIMILFQSRQFILTENIFITLHVNIAKQKKH